MIEYLDLVNNQTDMERTAVIDGENKFTFRDLMERIGTMQQSLPYKQGDKIAIYLPNNFDHIAAYFGIVLSEMTAVPLNIQMKEYEIISLLKWADVCAVITSKQNCVMFEKVTKSSHSGLNIIYVEDICRPEITSFPVVMPRVEDTPMVFLSTSGTTGNAKIVQLSQRNIETSVFGFLDKMNFEEDNPEDFRFILAIPFSSAYGIMILSVFMIRRFTMVLLPNNFTLETLYKTIETHRVTHYEGGHLTIQLMNQMAGRTNVYDISSLKYMGFGGGKISAEETKNLENAYPQIMFCQGYGMTEASPLVSKHQRPNIKKTESAGTAIKGVEIAVESDGVITKDAYVKGEIVIRGAGVMLGYYNNQKETDQIIRDGYLYSGDIGYLDEEGYLYICGRRKNIIIVRGFNVHPEEVEKCILGSNLAADCVVYGELDIAGREVVCADIVPNHLHVTIEEIKAYCNSHLADFKLPQKIQFCDSVKRNAAGKTERKRV